MAAPTPPTGVSQAELDAMFADLLLRGEAKKQEWMSSQVPVMYQPHWQYAQANPSTTSSAKTASGAVLASPCLCVMVICNTPGSANALTLNDAATVGGSNISNQIFSKLFSDMTAGQAIPINVNCAVGLTISSMPTGGNYTIVYSQTPPS